MATMTTRNLAFTLSPISLAALRLTPLLSTTASLTHAYMEWVTNRSFIGPAPVDSSLSRFLSNSSPAQATVAKRGTEVEHTHQQVEAAKELVVPEWFTHFFNTGVLSVIGLNTFTLVSAALNIAFDEDLRDNKIFYQAGLVFALGHYTFVPLVAPSIGALVGMATRRRNREGERDEEKGAVDWVREWVWWHKIRMSTVDVLAWGCFLWGVVNTHTNDK